VGYVAEGPGSDVWRGYLGRTFTPVGMGPPPLARRLLDDNGHDGCKSLLGFVQQEAVVSSETSRF